MTTTCDQCGATLRIGDYPFCPHGQGATGIEDVTWPGGRLIENLDHEPVRCDSPADLRREMDKRGLMPFVRHVPNDQHTRSWATMDPYTLEAARVLAERQAQSRPRGAADPPSAETVALVREVLAGRR